MLLYMYLYVYNYMYMYIYMSCLIYCCACALICFTVEEWETFFSIPLYVLTCKVIDNKATLTLTFDFDHWILGYLSDQGPLSPITQFGWAAKSRKTVSGSKSLPFQNDGGYRALPCSAVPYRPL